jgi:uncharacterized protein YecE (DUF72 family)
MENPELPLPECDVRFGSAGMPGGAGEGAVARAGLLSTRELAYGEWRLGPLMPAGVDCCVRLGKDFTRLPEGPRPGSRYAGTLAECRKLAQSAGSSLAAFLLEFPPSFVYKAETRRHLDRVLKDFSGFPVAAAFFDTGWYSSRVIEGLKARGVALCLLDLPRYLSAPPSMDVVTAPFVYARFYGREGAARQGRAAPGGACRGLARGLLDYEYDAAALSAWLPRLEALSAQSLKMRVIFASRRGRIGAGNAERFAALWAAHRAVRGEEA